MGGCRLAVTNDAANDVAVKGQAQVPPPLNDALVKLLGAGKRKFHQVEIGKLVPAAQRTVN